MLTRVALIAFIPLLAVLASARAFGNEPVGPAPPTATPKTDYTQSRPPAYLHCSLFVGEGELFDGTCRVTTLTGDRILVEAEKGPRYRLLIEPMHERDRFYWNGAPDGKAPSMLLGEAQWFDHCWRSVAHSEIPFNLCLSSPNQSK